MIQKLSYKRMHNEEDSGEVMEAIAGEKTLGELAQHYEVHPNQITTWKRQLTENADSVFGTSSSRDQGADVNCPIR